jgi:gamma-glutamylcyclotransferase
MLYAAYGSNLHPERLSLRLPRSRFLGTAAIAGMSLCFHKRGRDKSAKCNIVSGNGSIHVAVYDLDEQDKALLDRIEGVGLGYSVETIEAPGFTECFTYCATTSHIDSGIPTYSWYRELVLAGCEALDFPADYVAMIRKVAVIDDPDKERHVSNMQVVEKARESANGHYSKNIYRHSR